MERREELVDLILKEFDSATPEIIETWYLFIDNLIDNVDLRNKSIKVTAHGRYTQRYPIAANRLAEKYFIPKIPVFSKTWKEYLGKKLQALNEVTPEKLRPFIGHQFIVGYDKGQGCIALIVSKIESC